MSKDYTITLTEEQLSVVETALEWFVRLQMGQFFDYASEVAKCGYKYDRNDPNNDTKFDAYISRRNASQERFEAAFRVAQPAQCNQTEDMMVASDMWRDIRYKRWQDMPEPKRHDTVDAHEPMHISGLKPIVVSDIQEEKKGK